MQKASQYWHFKETVSRDVQPEKHPKFYFEFRLDFAEIFAIMRRWLRAMSHSAESWLHGKLQSAESKFATIAIENKKRN
jgi:hypothetical protein